IPVFEKPEQIPEPRILLNDTEAYYYSQMGQSLQTRETKEASKTLRLVVGTIPIVLTSLALLYAVDKVDAVSILSENLSHYGFPEVPFNISDYGFNNKLVRSTIMNQVTTAVGIDDMIKTMTDRLVGVEKDRFKSYAESIKDEEPSSRISNLLMKFIGAGKYYTPSDLK